MTQQTDKGVFDAADRILARLLETPAFTNSIRILFNHMDPSSSRRLVQTLLWRDMEFSLSLAAACPALINTLASLSDELFTQIQDHFPEEMLTGYVSELLNDIDPDTLQRAREKGRNLYQTLAPVLERALQTEARDCGESRESEGGPAAASGAPDDSRADTAAQSVLEEILRTPFLKEILRELAAGVDPENGSRTARTLMWTDMETALAVLGTLPALANFYIHALAETGEQLNDKMPPQLLVSFMAALFSDIDTEAAKRGAAAYKKLAQRVMEESGGSFVSGVHDLLTGPALTRNLAAGINLGAAGINRLEERHPGTLREAMAAVIGQTDKTCANQAFKHITAAVLDQRPPIFRLAGRAIRLYISAWFRRRKA